MSGDHPFQGRLSSAAHLRGAVSILPLPLLAMLLGLSALWVGWQWDDYILRFCATPPPQYAHKVFHPLMMFSIADGDPARSKELMDLGWLPWWTPDDFRMSFFRPLTALTHWLDFRLWPESSRLMHLHSLLWLGLLVGAAALLYRRMLGSGRFAFLAGLLFAVDDAHGVPAGWLANRNALVASFFGLLAVYFHDRWRKEGGRGWVSLSCFSMLLGLLGGEMALAAGGYLFAYALFIENSGWKQRVGSLLPCGVVGLGWLLFYRTMHFGAQGSPWYVDPGANPWEYVRALVERGPILLFGQLGFLPSDLFTLLSERGVIVFWFLAVVFLLFFAWVSLPVLRHDAVSRFFALGMVLSVLPIATTFPFDRLLVMAGFGGAGLVARILLAASRLFKRHILPLADVEGEETSPYPSGGAVSLAVKIMAILLLSTHLILSPVMMPLRAYSPAMLGDVLKKTFEQLTLGPGLEERTLLFVNGPTSAVGGVLLPMFLSGQGRPIPRGTHVLAPSIHGMTVSRPHSSALVITVDNGLLDTPDDDGQEEGFSGWVSPAYMLQRMDMSPRVFRGGEEVRLSAYRAEVERVTNEGRPLQVRFDFPVPLEDSALRWFEWLDGVYVPFTLPRPGETRRLHAPTGIAWDEN